MSVVYFYQQPRAVWIIAVLAYFSSLRKLIFWGFPIESYICINYFKFFILHTKKIIFNVFSSLSFFPKKSLSFIAYWILVAIFLSKITWRASSQMNPFIKVYVRMHCTVYLLPYYVLYINLDACSVCPMHEYSLQSFSFSMKFCSKSFFSLIFPCQVFNSTNLLYKSFFSTRVSFWGFL